MTRAQTHPCYQCTERTVGDDAGCHASCEKYQLWKRAHDEQQAALRRAGQGRQDARELADRKFCRIRKWFGLKGGGQR